MANWNWLVPGVSVRVPVTQNPIAADPMAWDSLTFGPMSLFDLRRHLGARTDEAGRFMASRRRFEAADIAWLAAGASDDGQHEVERNRFSPEFDTLRNETPIGTAGSAERKIFMELVKGTMKDLATKADRAIGSTTIILHIEGTTLPGAPLAPEFLKAQVHMPPSFIRDNPGSHAAIATIAQLFIEHFGVPTATAWEQRARARGWSLQGNSTIPAAPLTHHLPLIPTPAPHSTQYIFRGRPAGFSPITGAPPSRIVDIDDLERISELETELTSLSGDLWNSEEQVSVLQGVVADYEACHTASKARIAELEAEVARLQQEARAPQSLLSTPTSSSSRHRTPMTPSRPPPYLVSFATSPPTSSPSSSGRFAGTPRVPTQAASALGYHTHQFLEDEGLMEHHDALRLICRIFSPLKWAAEIELLSGFPAGAKDGLLTALEADGA
ncbi:hypothetical protein B0H10DRAFT_2229151 [Mycena sp. CBHHK59/15]|nr:hypothetical protein B0H10DRAFT_2229151 [Mycena sp. CBHHK59/15]